MADVADKQKIAPKTHKLELRAGQQQLVRAEAHVRYEVVDARTGHKPQQLKARRIGDNLELFTEDAAELATQAAAPQAQVVVEGYFSQPDVLLVAGSGEGAGSYAVTQEVTTNAFTTVGVLENAGALIPAAPFFSPLTTALAGAAGLAAVASTTDKTNSAPTIIAGTQSVQLVEAGGENNATTGTSAATVALTKADVDGTASFDTSWLSSNGWSTADSGATYTKAGTYGTATLTISTGVVSYALDNTKSATQALTASHVVSDSFAVQVTDGTATASANAVFNITGTNDAAVIGGTSTASLTETNAVQTASGTLSATDVDSAATFVAQIDVVGTNGYGKFSIDANGAWTYTMDSAHDEFVVGQNYTDSITVVTADGTSQVITVTITGANDAAVISGTSTGAVVEAGGDSNVIAGTPTATGTLTSIDVDGTANAFTAVSTATTSTGGYGSYTMTAAGVWTYTLNNSNAAVQALAANDTLTDTFTVTAADGTSQVVTVAITGANDAAVIGGTSTGAVVEAGGVSNAIAGTPSATGTLTSIDVDGTANAFTAVSTATTSTGGYGSYTMTAAGVWTYTLNNSNAAVQALAANDTLTDTFAAAAADGTTQVITVTITGTNDAAVITGSSTASLTETNAAQTASGNLMATDVDSAATFVAQTDVVGTNGYGKFSIDANGAWTYTMDSAYDEFVGEKNYTDSITVATADGTSQVITVTITGANDAAVITGSSTASLRETNAAQTASGNLMATDVDSAATFVAQTDVVGINGYGKFSIDANGAWTYTMDSAHDEFVGGQNYTDSITVATADGTTQVITVTITGTNDAAVITGTSTGELTEDATLTAVGKLTVIDLDDGEAVFQTPQYLKGNYGTYEIDVSTGEWSYLLDNTYVQKLGKYSVVTDSLNVVSADGSATQKIEVTIYGADDQAQIDVLADAKAHDSDKVIVLEKTNEFVQANGTLSVSPLDGDDWIKVTGVTFNFEKSSSLEGTGWTSSQIEQFYKYALQINDPFFSNGKPHNLIWNFQAMLDGSLPKDFRLVLDYSLSSVNALGTPEESIVDTHIVSIELTGTNAIASIGGVTSAEVTEDMVAYASGWLTITDADIGESVFQSPDNLKGDYGTFTFDERTGQWTYQVDNQAIQGLRSGYELQDKLTVRSKDDSASQDIVVTILGADDKALIDVVVDAKGSDQSNVDVVESVDHTRPSVSGTLTVGTMDYGDRIVVKGVKFNAAQSSSLEGTGLTAADIETGFLNSLSLTEITDNGGVHNLNWAFYTNGTLPKDFKLVLDYTLASVNSNGFFDTNGMPVGDTVDEQVLTIATTGVNSVVTVNKQGADADTLSVTETNGLVESPLHSLTVNEWDYGDLINVAVQSAKVDLPKTNFLTETTPGLAAFESYIKSWLQVDLGDLAGTSNLKWKFATIYADDLDFVPANSQLVIDYTLAISENGQPATTQNIEITIDGVNDAPVYELQTTDSNGATLDLKADTAIQQASGTLSPYDADFADSISHEVKDVSWNASSQGITQEQFDTWKLTLKDLLTIDIGPDYGMSHSLTWYFNQAGADIKSAMPTGSTLSMDYTLRVTDALGAWSDQKIHIDLYA